MLAMYYAHELHAAMRGYRDTKTDPALAPLAAAYAQAGRDLYGLLRKHTGGNIEARRTLREAERYFRRCC